MWLSLAKAQGHKKAAKGLDVKEKMTPVDKSKAQTLTTEWWEKHNN